jgi:flagellar hook-basal body complex protein FliE
MSTPTAAANAYAALARLSNPSAGAPKSPGTEGSEASFGSLLKDALGAVAEAGRTSDQQAKAMASGSSNIVDVVTAVAETEVAIEALVSVRDKVIQAYEEIMRMPI